MEKRLRTTVATLWPRLGAYLCFITLFSAIALSQDTTSGGVQGTVSDEQGSAVAGAQVEARNTETNFLRTFVTDADGRFTILSLPPGSYIVSVTKTGFG